MQLLVVEPDANMGRTYQRYLEQAGHGVRWRQTAATAIDALDEQPADVIVLELNLPGHNGMEFLYEMRSYADWQDIPVLIHSFTPAHKLVGGLAYQELGIANYLYKPETSLQDLERSLSVLVAP